MLECFPNSIILYILFNAGRKLISVYCSLSHLTTSQTFKSVNPDLCNLLFPIRAL